MTQAEDIVEQIAALKQQLHTVYRVRGSDLGQAMRRARRFLPRHVRRAGAVLSQAEPMLGHPKLETALDFDALSAAQNEIVTHLDGVDMKARRQKWLLGMAGLVSFYVIFTAVCFVIWMRWAGQI